MSENKINAPEVSDDKKENVIEQKTSTELDMLNLLKLSEFDIRNFSEDFIDEFENHTEDVLLRLLSLQSNEAPLKKGGENIAYRSDIFILKNRQMYNSHENTLFDIISGCVSSNPDLTTYKIYPKDVKKMLPFVDKSYLYKLLHDAVESMRDKPLIFEIQMPNGRKRKVAMPWYQVLTYEDCDSSSGNFSYISFKPTSFFKILLISASIVHGAYYRINVSAKVSSKYSRNIFYILESRKKYRTYYSSDTGNFTIPIADFQQLIGFPANYRINDIKRRILDVAKKDINNLDDCDFIFDYEFVKGKPDPDKRKQTSHILFKIALKDIIKGEEIDKLAQISEDDMAMSYLRQVNITDYERGLILKKYHNNNRTLDYLLRAIQSVESANKVINKAAVLQSIMDNDYSLKSKIDYKMGKNGQYSFVEKRDYDFDELELLLVNNLSDDQQKKKEDFLKNNDNEN